MTVFPEKPQLLLPLPPPPPLTSTTTNGLPGLDLDALGIVDGKFCWVVFVDILVLQVSMARGQGRVVEIRKVEVLIFCNRCTGKWAARSRAKAWILTRLHQGNTCEWPSAPHAPKGRFLSAAMVAKGMDSNKQSSSSSSPATDSPLSYTTPSPPPSPPALFRPTGTCWTRVPSRRTRPSTPLEYLRYAVVYSPGACPPPHVSTEIPRCTANIFLKFGRAALPGHGGPPGCGES